MTLNTEIEYLKSENQRLNILIDLAKLFGSEAKFDNLLQIIINQTCKLFQTERATIFIVDYKTNELWSRVGSGIKLNEIRFGIDKGIASLVATTKESILLEDAYNHPNFNKEVDLSTGFKTTSLLAVPMLNTEGKVVGVFEIMNKWDRTPFDTHDETILKGIASLAAVRLENALLVEELKLNERLSTVGNLTSSISHEIKNLLSPLSLVELIPGLTSGDSRIQEYCDLISQARDQTLELLSEIREMVVDKKFDMQPEDLSVLVKEVVTLMQFDSNLKNCTLNSEIQNLEPLIANKGKLKQVLVNLIRNAAQAMPQSKKGEIKVKVYEEKGKTHVAVSDNGVGIPPENIKQIWQPFFSTKSGTGTGLGLGICKKIIEAHGATITCKSEVNHGTTFTIAFP